MKTTPDIFEFVNYRSFLSTYFEDAKKRNLHWSYEAWAKKLGLKNNSSILKIIHGQREAGSTISKKLAEYFGFNNDERIYFEDLIRLSKAKNDPGLSVAIIEKIQKQFPKKTYRLLNEKEFSAISHWWFYAIRQMTKLKNFKNDPVWISKKLNFKVSPKEVRKAIQIMLELGLLRYEKESDSLKISKECLNTSDDIASEAIKRFHEEMLSHAKKAIRSISVAEREISGCTITIAKEDMQKAKDLIRHFEEEFCKLLDKKNGNEVYQLNIQLFPLTKINKFKEANKTLKQGGHKK